MFNLRAQYQEYQAQRKRVKEAFNQAKQDIERERDLLNPRSVFLKDSFFKYAIGSTLQTDQNFQERYGDGLCHIQDWFGVINPALHKYQLSYFHLRGQDKQDAYDKMVVRANDTIANRIQSVGDESQVFYWGDEELSVDAFRQRVIDNRKKHNDYDGFRLSDLAVLFSESGYFQYEDQAIKMGQGNTILDFWKSMRKLEDYQCYFPDEGGKGNNKNEKNKLKELVDKMGKPLIPAYG